MSIRGTTRLTLARAFAILVFGFASGMQVALYMYDYFDDGIAEDLSLWIGLAMVGLAVGFVLISFRRKGSPSDGDTS